MEGDRDPAEVLADAIERGQAFLDEGASCVFVPGVGDPNTIAQLVDGIGVGKVSVIARRGGLTMTDLARLGVARVSCGPWTQQLAMEAVAEVGATLFAGGAFPAAAQ
jgi:2-methylisocitrate lyase-like PEP mutase family enzyme